MKVHSIGKGSKFCRRYNVRILVYYELFPNIMSAIRREKQLKKWRREWKLELIRKKNPQMKDLLQKEKYLGK
jgi:putative endonuclease